MFLGELVMEVVDLLPIVVGLIVPDITEISCGIKLCGEGFTDIPTDDVHSGGPHMVQPRFEPVRVSAKLAHMGTNKQVFQVSGTLVTFVLMAREGQGFRHPRWVTGRGTNG